MSITARILLGSLVLSIAGVLLFLSLVSKRVGQAYREAVEEPMVDTAEVFAGVISNEIESSGSFSGSWERGFQAANHRTLHAQIYSLLKTRISMDLYVTDSGGIVQFDSGHPENVGRNFRALRDVSMTLQGHYGARATLQEADPKGMILYVAAPIFVKGQVWGVATYPGHQPVNEAQASGFVLLARSLICTTALLRSRTAKTDRARKQC